jgi:hypothetical protein
MQIGDLLLVGCAQANLNPNGYGEFDADAWTSGHNGWLTLSISKAQALTTGRLASGTNTNSEGTVRLGPGLAGGSALVVRSFECL